MTGLYILLGIAAFLSLILFVPIGFDIVYEDKPEIFLRWLLLKIRLVPLPEKKTRAKEALGLRKFFAKIFDLINKFKDKHGIKRRQKPKKKPSEKQKGSFWQELREERGFLGAIGFLTNIVGYLADTSKRVIAETSVGKFVAVFSVAGEDPDEAANNYGYCCAAIFPLISLLGCAFKKFERKIFINPEFVSSESWFKFKLLVSVTLFTLLRYALRAILKLVTDVYKQKISKAAGAAEASILI